MEKAPLDNLRHSCALLLAAAVMERWPDARPTLGPPIEDGFYYDFDFSAVKISEADLGKIEEKMRALLPVWTRFSREIVSPDQAREVFAGNVYKQELIDEIVMKIGRASCRERVEISVVAGSLKKRRRNKRWNCDWSSDVCSSDLRLSARIRRARYLRGMFTNRS